MEPFRTRSVVAAATSHATVERTIVGSVLERETRRHECTCTCFDKFQKARRLLQPMGCKRWKFEMGSAHLSLQFRPINPSTPASPSPAIAHRRPSRQKTHGPLLPEHSAAGTPPPTTAVGDSLVRDQGQRSHLPRCQLPLLKVAASSSSSLRPPSPPRLPRSRGTLDLQLPLYQLVSEAPVLHAQLLYHHCEVGDGWSISGGVNSWPCQLLLLGPDLPRRRTVCCAVLRHLQSSSRGCPLPRHRDVHLGARTHGNVLWQCG